MRIEVNGIYGQFYFLPFVKTTYTKALNGNIELIFGWMNFELVISLK
jgi:hypothetical protein